MRLKRLTPALAARHFDCKIGRICLMRPVSKRARAWWDHNVNWEPWQEQGEYVRVEAECCSRILGYYFEEIGYELRQPRQRLKKLT